jgi:hypothetical protein
MLGVLLILTAFEGEGTLKMSFLDCCKRVVKSIFPPKTPRESLVLLYIAQELVSYLNYDEEPQIEEWYGNPASKQ